MNVKVIGAMNIEPLEAIDEGIIRKDLFYRFSGGLITLPPLRERKEDIILFIKYYVDYYKRAYSKEVTGVDEEVRQMFMNYSWDGNVRELSNTIESMITSLKDGTVLTREQIPKYMLEKMERERDERLGVFSQEESETAKLLAHNSDSRRIAYHEIMEAVERKMVENALEMAHGNKTKAGEILGLPRKTLVYRMEKLGLR